MKNALIVFIVTFSFSIIACSEPDKESGKHTKVKIRLTNTGDFDYSDVYVSTSGGEFNYGNINSNESTDYHEFEWAYSYAYIQLKINDKMYKIQPIDYVGEKKLENGNYTYEIGAKPEDSEYRLTLSLVVD